MNSISDPAPLGDALLGVGVCLALPFVAWRYWKHKASERWPWAAAIYGDGRVQVWHGKYGNNYSVFVKLSYQVDGKTYRGWYWKLLSGSGEAGAEKLLRSLREGPLYVRYRPSKPKVYICDPLRDVRP